MRKKRRLKTAPLILVHLEINWSELPEPSVFSPEELKVFHKSMSTLGLPDKETLTDSFHQFQIIHSAPEITPTDRIRHLFSNGSSDCQIEVNQSKLIIRQARYDGIEKLLELTSDVVDALKHVNDISNSVIELISLHHVDIFIPALGSELSSYVSPDNLISYKPSIEGAISTRSTSSSVTLLEHSDEKVRDIALRFNVQSFKDGKLSLLIPPELQESNPKAAMPLYLPKISFDPNSEYGIMDIRHAVRYFKRPVFSEFDHLNQLYSLYQTSNDVFWGVLSQKALDEWGVEEYEN